MNYTNNFEADMIVHKVQSFPNGGMNISAFIPGGKDKNSGDFKPSTWFNLRPVKAIEHTSSRLEAKDKIKIRGFFASYMTKTEPPKSMPYVVCMDMEITGKPATKPQTPARGHEAPNDDDLPF